MWVFNIFLVMMRLSFKLMTHDRLRNSWLVYLINEFFEMYKTHLRYQGLEARGGQIIDSKLVPVLQHRNSQELCPK